MNLYPWISFRKFQLSIIRLKHSLYFKNFFQKLEQLLFYQSHSLEFEFCQTSLYWNDICSRRLTLSHFFHYRFEFLSASWDSLSHLGILGAPRSLHVIFLDQFVQMFWWGNSTTFQLALVWSLNQISVCEFCRLRVRESLFHVTYCFYPSIYFFCVPHLICFLNSFCPSRDRPRQSR